MKVLHERLLQEIHAFPGGSTTIIEGINTCTELSEGEQRHYFRTLKLDFIALMVKDNMPIEREAILFKHHTETAVIHLKKMIENHGCPVCTFLLKLKEMEMHYVASGVIQL